MAGVGSTDGQSLTEVNAPLPSPKIQLAMPSRLLAGGDARRDVVAEEAAEAVEPDRPEGEERRLALVVDLDEEEAELLGFGTARRIAPDDLAAERPLVVLEVAKLLLVVGGQVLAGLDLLVADADIDRDAALLAADRGQRLADVDHAAGIDDRRHQEREFRVLLQLRHRLDREVGTPEDHHPGGGRRDRHRGVAEPAEAMLTPRLSVSPSPVRTALISVTGRGIAELPSVCDQLDVGDLPRRDDGRALFEQPRQPVVDLREDLEPRLDRPIVGHDAPRSGRKRRNRLPNSSSRLPLSSADSSAEPKSPIRFEPTLIEALASQLDQVGDDGSPC